MKRYIALLRGINISGKKKIAMSELKKGFAELGFAEVTTYLNSGNVIFIMPPLSYEEVYDEIGDPKAEYEQVHNYKNAISGLSAERTTRRQIGGPGLPAPI